MMTTTYRIEFDSGSPDPERKWRLAKDTTERYWKRDLGKLLKACPNDVYRVVKEITITETITETLG